ncbi:hypothetical protein Xcc1_41630 [Xanthomonas campestris pv. campestris]|nr:hypothetical protein Xcc1_41630 [Xanthomonas campestris pv. campestris]
MSAASPAPDDLATLMAPSADGMRYALYSPTAMPTAGGFLWNRRMMVQLTCRGYATAQFMQPEPAKYAHAPLLEARNFMMPEQPYYAHHPGRFFYLKDEDTGALYSVPHEPVRAPAEAFRVFRRQARCALAGAPRRHRGGAVRVAAHRRCGGVVGMPGA